MLKQNKWKILISSLVTLLPAVFGLIMWKQLPGNVATHWGVDGVADGFSSKAFAVFGMPCILLAIYWLCLLATVLLDKKQQNQNAKAMNIVFWIIPALSLVINGVFYCIALTDTFNAIWLMPVLMGALFIYIGNYLPKVKQNKTLGIRISWTLRNEENWNKTHRFGGKVWFVAGLLILLSALLPPKGMAAVFFAIVLLAIMIPTVYSYLIYKRHQKEGVEYEALVKTKGDKIGVIITAVLVLLILIGVCVLMFTGKVAVQCEETTFTVDATYWSELEVEYATVEHLSYLTEHDHGTRVNGFASAVCSLGRYKNEANGSYTLYAHNGATEFVRIIYKGKVLVIGLKDPAQTKAVYDTLLSKVQL